MLAKEQIEAAAARLDEAERARTQIRMFSQDHPGMTIEDAYAVQRAWIARKLDAGRRIRGHKIGLTSKAMQNAVNIREPDYGVLLDDMFYYDGAQIPSERYISLRIEAELAFVLKEPLTGPECTIFDVLNATDYVTPALEVLDTRLQRLDPETKATRKVTDTISDNASNAALVIGGRPFKPFDVDMRWISALVFRNGQIEETGVAAGVLNHPANGVAWLANKLHPHGVALDPGQVILAGSFIRPIDAAKGDTFHADYGPFGTVSCHFA
ncbi:MAG TPA: 2-oxo-hepta-3-ene-1,7-dioic acid hydratase [Hyphomicrobiaceae bacterium]|nr:2-oxo-hepta-3-ene-1,7-dioic acid hydratase [Hyphomicrobiaceae bacterium]